MDYVKLLKDKFESTKANIQEASDVDALRNVFKESMNYYSKRLIPDFFSSKDGEGSKIKSMYQQLRDKSESRVVVESSVDCIDLNVAGGAYADYLTGMCKFIEETCEYSIDEEKYAAESAICEQKMNTAKQHDGEFIDSIFGGINNASQTGTVLESVGNIEYLIDFMDTIKEESAQCDHIFDLISKSNSNADGSLLMESARMMTESVNYYVYNTLQTVFDSYNAIHNVLETGYQPASTKKQRRMVF